MAGVTLKNLTKKYKDAEAPALEGLDLDIRDGEFLVLVGPSGCGKSTALKLIGGLEDVTAGEIKIGDQLVNDFASRDRNIAMVFQSYALYPHMTVFDNIAFPLQIAKVSRDEIVRRVEDVAKTLQLESYLYRKPSHLSGGQRQRVAMGRAIIRHPSVFLLDEPLSNLDAKLRVKMRAEVAQIQRQLKVTTIYVTHDQVEAMTMGDRVALMRGGILQQVDEPQILYHLPANTFVASFIGSPAMNLFKATIEQDNEKLIARIGDQSLRITDAVIKKYSLVSDYIGREVIIGVRPEDLEDANLVAVHPKDHFLSGSVLLVESLGSDQMAHISVNAPTVRDGEDDDAMSSLEGERNVCICRFSSQSPVKMGDVAKVVVTCDRLHLFNANTGRALRPI